MWQQAALPHPPLPVSHDHLGDTLAGAGDGSEGDPQVDPLNTYTNTYIHKQTHPRLQGFAINQKWEKGRRVWGMKEALSLSKCRNQGQDREINLI